MTTATTTREVTTIVFSNHLPLRTRQEIEGVWLCYDYLDFGGHYFCYCPCVREPGKYHCWLRHNSAYTDGRRYAEYLGLFWDYESLLAVLNVHDSETGEPRDMNYEHIGSIVQALIDVIEMPEC